MKIIHARQWPLQFLKGPSIFLAGPTPRDKNTPSWRKKAVEHFSENDLNILIPEDRGWGLEDDSYTNQVLWEWEALDIADVIAFWIPRDLAVLPGFTTNVEFGMYWNSKKIIAGWPIATPKVHYLQMLYHRGTGEQPYSTLEALCHAAQHKATCSK
jgi:hypothetical protein